jgi:hypothetical protein
MPSIIWIYGFCDNMHAHYPPQGPMLGNSVTQTNDGSLRMVSPGPRSNASPLLGLSVTRNCICGGRVNYLLSYIVCRIKLWIVMGTVNVFFWNWNWLSWTQNRDIQSTHVIHMPIRQYVTQSSNTVVPDDKALHCIYLLVTYVVQKTPAVNNVPVRLSAVHYRNFTYSCPCPVDCLVAHVRSRGQTLELFLRLLG